MEGMDRNKKKKKKVEIKKQTCVLLAESGQKCKMDGGIQH